MKSQGKIKLAREIAGRTAPRFVSVQSERRVRRAPKYIINYLRRAIKETNEINETSKPAGHLDNSLFALERALDWAEGR